MCVMKGHAVKAWGEVELQVHIYITWTTHGGRPGCFRRVGISPVIQLEEAWWASLLVLTFCGEKISCTCREPNSGY